MPSAQTGSYMPLNVGILATYAHPANTTQVIHNGFSGNVFPDGTRLILVTVLTGTINIRETTTDRVVAILSTAGQTFGIELSGGRVMGSVEINSDATGTATVSAWS